MASFPTRTLWCSQQRACQPGRRSSPSTLPSSSPSRPDSSSSIALRLGPAGWRLWYQCWSFWCWRILRQFLVQRISFSGQLCGCSNNVRLSREVVAVEAPWEVTSHLKMVMMVVEGIQIPKDILHHSHFFVVILVVLSQVQALTMSSGLEGSNTRGSRWDSSSSTLCLWQIISYIFTN